MEALECIKTRRSVRKFTEEAVSREQMAEVVAAAAYAPSWKNTQTARYNFVTDKEKIARLASDCMMDFAYNQKTASHAPALVILTTITGRSGFERDGSFSTSKGTHWQSFDAGIAAEAQQHQIEQQQHHAGGDFTNERGQTGRAQARHTADAQRRFDEMEAAGRSPQVRQQH